jgi:hypothetical protein
LILTPNEDAPPVQTVTPPKLRSYSSVFERYNIVSDGDLRSAATQLGGRTGKKQGQSAAFSAASERENVEIAQ